jgi:sulfate adenylyltransferase
MINYTEADARYLIDYANLKHGLIKNQNDFLSKKKFDNFVKKNYLGFPLVLPMGIKYFDYSKSIQKFTVSKSDAKKFIFRCKSDNYIGMKIFFRYGNTFCSGATIKKKYKKDLNLIIDFNEKLKLSIKKHKNNYKISSFQTRNIPHLGHELIIQKLMGTGKILIINPLIGIKKKGDIKNNILKKVFKYLISIKRYKNKILYGPVICNMNYAGPREALHHTYIRELLGFDEFSIGRDHAGAENNYPPLEAINFVKKNKKKFKIDIFFHKGAYYCGKCKKIILKGDCDHRILDNISGSQFREKLESKIFFLHARKSLQRYINKLKLNLFN